MLLSYVLDAGRSNHGLDALATRYFDHTTIDHDALIGSGKSRVPFDCVDIGKAAEYAAERADVILRSWQLLKPRLTVDHVTTVYETLERPLAEVLARMERRGISIDRQVLSRLSGEFAQRAAGARSRSPPARRRAGVQSRQPEATRRHPVRQVRSSRRHQDQDRPMGDRRARARRACRARPSTAAEDSGMAAGHQAQVDLHRRAAGLRQSDDPSRAHELRAGGDADRPPLLLRAEPAEHSGPHRGGPQDPARVHRIATATSSSRPTTRRSSCGCSPRLPTSRRCATPSATASTFTR